MDTRESIILIPAPAADKIVRSLREMYDHVANHGIPSHITLLFPFRLPDAIDETVLQKLKDVFQKIEPFSFSFNSVGTFPSVVFLKPNKIEKFREIVDTIVTVFPDTPPYKGAHPVNPHLTIAQLSEKQNLQEIKNEIHKQIGNALPIDSIADEAWLMTSKDGEWSLVEKFPFAKD